MSKLELLNLNGEKVKDIKLNDNVYLFEGFMDVIAAYRAGIYNSVASMGTALTLQQIIFFFSAFSARRISSGSIMPIASCNLSDFI